MKWGFAQLLEEHGEVRFDVSQENNAVLMYKQL